MESGPTSETLEIVMREPAVKLVVEVQDDSGVRRVPVGKSPLVVGTAKSSDIVVVDRTVSARHCILFGQRTGIGVRDLGSRNGTYVGGARVQEAWGGEGMTVLVGRTTLVCRPAESPLEADELGPCLPGIAGGSMPMARLATQVRRLARLTSPVLVAGETGVGKELVARALHLEGPRASGPFVALNVAALPRELVESELFGHERGAFTGAVQRRAGAFTEAAGGTLFLDEIGELPLDAQPKLLRALDGYEVRRVGGAGGTRADVRVVAATHVPLLEHVRAGRFRRDLFHRLEVFVVELPPLRDRRGDILAIAKTLLEQMEPEIRRRELTPAAVAALMAHDWPGNVRELRNVLYRAADVAVDDRLIDAVAVARAIRRTSAPPPAAELTPELARVWLERHDGNVSAAARAAQVPRTTFRKLLERAEMPGEGAGGAPCGGDGEE